MSFFVDNLKQLRKAANMTQEQLSEAIISKRSTIANIENRGTEPTLDIIIKLSDYFNMSIDSLIGRSTDKLSNRAHIDTIFDLPLNETLQLNSQPPMWFRYNELPTQYEPTGYIQGHGKIELYNPLNYHCGDQRIYLDFLNTSDSYEFFKKYGYLGRVTLDESQPYDINIFHAMFDSNYVLKRTLGSLFYKDNLLYLRDISDEIMEEVNKVKNVQICTESILSECLETFKFASKDNLDHLTGYYESSTGYLINQMAMRNIVFAIKANINKEIYESINKYMSDIIFIWTEKDGEFMPTFIYQSLISLMFFELLHDIVNMKYPVQCCLCNKQYFLGQKGINQVCPKCVEKLAK